MKNEFDNNLTDKGWQSMRRLLDRDMPEQRRRRRFAWWWFALLLLPLVGAGGWWLLRDSKPVDRVPKMDVPKDSKPVVGAEGEENLPNVPAVVGVPANNKRRNSIPGEKDPATVQPLTQSVVGGDANNGKNNGKQDADIVKKSTAHLLGHSRDVSLAGTPTTAKEMPTTAETTANETYSVENAKSPQASAVVKTAPQFDHAEKLENLPIVPQFVENQNPNAINLTTATILQPAFTQKHATQKRWSFGLSAGLASENLSTVNGFSAGAAVDWQFARKWGLRSGLHYAQYRLSAEERPVVSLEADQYADATGNLVDLDTSGGSLNNPVPSVSSPEVLVPVERLRRLEMPLLMYWQPVRPLRIFGGISMNYTFSAKASTESFVNNDSYFASTKQAQSNLNELATSNLRHWQTNLQTGLGIRLGKRFELDVFYQYAIPDMKKGNDMGTFDPSTGNAGEAIEQRKGATHNFLLNGILFF